MGNYEIKFLDKLPNDIEEIMRQGCSEYERSNGIDVNYKGFAIVLLDANQHIIGVLNAYTAFAEIYVCDLWVHKDHRNYGYGRKLLQTLEDSFKGRGFNNISLVTSAFQAPEFYKKCGFEVEFVRKNTKNPKLTKTFFIKYFNEEVQKQGILEH